MHSKCKMFRQPCLSLTPNGNYHTTEYRADALFIFNVKISHESWLIIDHVQDHSYAPQFSVSAVCTNSTSLQMVCDVALNMNKILMKCGDYYWLYIFYFREKQKLSSSFSSCCFRSFHINSRLNWNHFTILMILCHQYLAQRQRQRVQFWIKKTRRILVNNV